MIPEMALIQNSHLTLNGNATLIIRSTVDSAMINSTILVNSTVASPVQFLLFSAFYSVSIVDSTFQSILTTPVASRAITISSMPMDRITVHNCSITSFYHSIALFVSSIGDKSIQVISITNSDISNLGGVFLGALTSNIDTARVFIENNTFTGMSRLDDGISNFPFLATQFLTVTQNSFDGWWSFNTFGSLWMDSNNFTGADTLLSSTGASFVWSLSNRWEGSTCRIFDALLTTLERETLNGADFLVESTQVSATHIHSDSSYFAINTTRGTLASVSLITIIQYSTFYVPSAAHISIEATLFYFYETDFIPILSPIPTPTSSPLSSSPSSTPPSPSSTSAVDTLLNLYSPAYPTILFGDLSAHGINIELRTSMNSAENANRTDIYFFGRLFLQRSLSGTSFVNGQSLPIPFANAGSIILAQSETDGSPVEITNIDFASYANGSFIASLFNPSLPVANFNGPNDFLVSNHSLYFFIDGPKTPANGILAGSLLTIFNGSLDLEHPFKKITPIDSALGYEGTVTYNSTGASSSIDASVQFSVSRTFCSSNCSSQGQCVGPNRCQCNPYHTGHDCRCSGLKDGAVCISNSYAQGLYYGTSLERGTSFPDTTDVIFDGDILVQETDPSPMQFKNARYDTRGRIIVSGTLNVETRIERAANASDSKFACFFRTESRSSSSGLSFGSNGVVQVSIDLSGAEQSICPDFENSTIGTVPQDATHASPNNPASGSKRASSYAGYALQAQRSVQRLLEQVMQRPNEARNLDTFNYRASRRSARDTSTGQFDTSRATKSAALFEFDAFDLSQNGGGIVKIDLKGPAPKQPIEIRLLSAKVAQDNALNSEGLVIPGVSTGLSAITIEVSPSDKTCHELKTGPGIVSLFLTPCGGSPSNPKKRLVWYAYGIPIILVGLFLIAAVIVILASSTVRGIFRPFSAASAHRAEEHAKQTERG